MKSPRIHIQLAVLAFILLPAVAGIVAVNASATCERFVRNYITKPVRNRVSKTTAEAWATWRVGHPNWKPSPALHRPKYIMNRDEAVQKVDFACTVPLIPTNLDGLLEADVPPVINFSPMNATRIQFPDVIPPEVAELTPQDEWPPLAPYLPPIFGSGGPIGGGVPIFPIVPPPVSTPVSGNVPEPSSLVLLATGLGLVALWTAKKRTSTQPAA